MKIIKFFLVSLLLIAIGFYFAFNNSRRVDISWNKEDFSTAIEKSI